MPPVELHGLHALTNPNKLGGVPIGIVFDNDARMAADARQHIAAQSALPQTIFVSPSIIADFQLDCRSATQQIAASPTAVIGVMGLLLEHQKLPRRYVAFDSTLGISTATIIDGTPVIEQKPVAIQMKPPIATAIGPLWTKLTAIDPLLFQGLSIADIALTDELLIFPVDRPLELAAAPERDIALLEILKAADMKGLIAIDTDGGLSKQTYAATLLAGDKPEMTDPLSLCGVLARHVNAIRGTRAIHFSIKQHASRHSRLCHAVAHPANDHDAAEHLLIGGGCLIGPICHFSQLDNAAA